MSLPGFFEHLVSPVDFFTMQGCIHLSLCHESWIVQRSMSNKFVFLLESFCECLALTTELNHLLAVE